MSRDFSKARHAKIIAQKGFEDINGSFFGEPRNVPRPTKADLRKEANAAVAGAEFITKFIECRCGHTGKVKIPISRVRGPFRCISCRERRN